jgi:hypothetical protein
MELNSSFLGYFKYEEKHTAVNLAQELKPVTSECGAETEVVAVVNDNAANIIVALRLAKL